MRKLFCLIIGHDYESIQRFRGMGGELVGCKRCHRLFAMNHGLRIIVPWDWEFTEICREFGYEPNVGFYNDRKKK